MTELFSRSVEIDCSVDEAFAWHERPGALARLTPPWETVEVESQEGGIQNGARVVLRSKVGPVWTRWVVEHFGYEQGRLFCDRLLQGPFASWEHRHRFEELEAGKCRLTDEIRYRLPGGAVGQLGAGFTRAKLQRMFAYRHAVTKADLELPKARARRVLVSGASGLLGSALAGWLRLQGWLVDTLVRRAPKQENEIRWDPARGEVAWPADYQCDAVVHLAGANIAAGRWTARRKESILRSRVDGTRGLVNALERLSKPPAVFLCGSATGFYGNRGDESLNETSPGGDGFLAEVCRAWEEAADGLAKRGVRVVKLRTGIVLSPAVGALARMGPIFAMGGGGPVGDGQQWQSWISLDDWLRACRHILVTDELSGPVNMAAVGAVRQREFARTLGAVMRRPAVVPAPEWVLRLGLGQMADEVLLASTRVRPARLMESDFEFLHPSLVKALQHVLGRDAGP